MNENLKVRVCQAKYSWPKNIDVDPNLKKLVDEMLVMQPDKRRGHLPILPEDGTLGEHDEMRYHPFFLTFPWKHMRQRRLAVRGRVLMHE